jgi:cobyrinic acid a,c-diamide synthase
MSYAANTHGVTARGLLISAPRSGAGKTTVTLGILKALSRRGISVRSAKAGPDYIDGAFHAAATGRGSVNLDSWAMPPMLIDALVAGAARDADTACPALPGAAAPRRTLPRG